MCYNNDKHWDKWHLLFKISIYDINYLLLVRMKKMFHIPLGLSIVLFYRKTLMLTLCEFLPRIKQFLLEILDCPSETHASPEFSQSMISLRNSPWKYMYYPVTCTEIPIILELS